MKHPFPLGKPEAPEHKILLDYINFLLDLSSQTSVPFLQLNEISGPPYPSFTEVEPRQMFSKILMYLVDFRVCSWLDVHPSPLFGPRNWTRHAVPRLICSSLMPRSYKLHSPTRKSSTSFERKATQHDWAKSRLFVQQKPLHGPRLTSFRKLRPASQELRMHPGTYWIFVVRELLKI